MKVLIAFECSGRMLGEFLELGADAYSCDLKASESEQLQGRHIRGDVSKVVGDSWDLLVAHPPCTRLTNAGARWYTKSPTNPPPTCSEREAADWAGLSERDRQAVLASHLVSAGDLFKSVLNAEHIPYRAVENPIMHWRGREAIGGCRQSQVVQPWHFGDPAFKATCWWLKNLPCLVPTNKLDTPKKGTKEHQEWSAIHLCSPGPERATIRSRTFPGMAKAAANQWMAYIKNEH